MRTLANGEAVSEIRRWLQLYRTLNGAANNLHPMPEEAMDFIVSAASIVAQQVIEAPAHSDEDIADKFRLLAELIDDPAGRSVMADDCFADATAAFHALDRYAFNRLRATPSLEAAE